jgi:hypothetical protein
MNTTLEHAIAYHQLGFSVVPVDPTQKTGDDVARQTALGNGRGRMSVLVREPIQSLPHRPCVRRRFWKPGSA